MSAALQEQSCDQRIFSSPPMVFERKTGLQDLSMAWVMPFGLTHEETEKLINDDAVKIIRSYFGGSHGSDGTILDGSEQRRLAIWFDLFKSNNPELQKLDHLLTDPVHFADAALGITSRFNIHDMEFYLTTSFEERAQVTDYHKRVNKIELKTDIGIWWVASPYTLGKMEEQISGHSIYGNRPLRPDEIERLDEYGFAKRRVDLL